MEPVFNKRVSFNSNDLLIDHTIDVKYYSDNHLSNKRKKDENEQKIIDFISDKNKFKIKPYYNQIEVVDFLSSKLRAMEKMDLDDECSEGKVETRKIDIDKNIFPKSKHSKDKKNSNSPEKTKNHEKNSRRKSKNKKTNKESDLFDDINLTTNKYEKEKEKELSNFFSDKSLLVSIINEMK